jgi:hypothetical protein
MLQGLSLVDFSGRENSLHPTVSRINLSLRLKIENSVGHGCSTRVTVRPDRGDQSDYLEGNSTLPIFKWEVSLINSEN